MIWCIEVVLLSFVIAIIGCQNASNEGKKNPQKEGYYYSVFLTYLTTFGFLIPVTCLIVLVLARIL